MDADGLRTPFVPSRDLIYVNVAVALAYRRGLRHIVGGICETNYTGCPDCRDDTTKAMQIALTLGMDRRIVMHTPLIWIDKAESRALVDRLGGATLTNIILKEMHTCYTGDHATRHSWSYGCGECPACELRVTGYGRWERQKR